jgi:hypothetical protein
MSMSDVDRTLDDVNDDDTRGSDGVPKERKDSAYHNERYQLFVHHLPDSPKWWDYLCYIPLSIRMFFIRLVDAFGIKVRRLRA